MPSPEAAQAEQTIQDYKAGVIGMGQELTMDERRTVTDGIGLWGVERDDVASERLTLGHRPASLSTPSEVDGDMVILYLHGGGYVMGSLDSHGRLMGHLAHHCRTPVYGLDFRRAPEDPYPAALDDAKAAYSALVEQGWKADQIVLAGDSAGGGLALAVMSILRDAGEELPAGAMVFSPWLDLALTGDSIERLAADDPWTTRAALDTFGKFYAGDAALDDPLISPVYMDFKGLPPLLIHVSSSEILLDDATRAHAKAETAGVDVEFRSWDGVPHVFQLFAGNLPEADESLEAAAAWFATTLRVAPPMHA